MAIELVGVFRILLEPPMRSNAVLGSSMMLACPDLDFKELAARTKDSRMQRLVSIGLGLCDVIFDPLLERGPSVVNDSKRVIALGDGVHKHTNGEQIIDLVIRLVAR